MAGMREAATQGDVGFWLLAIHQDPDPDPGTIHSGVKVTPFW